MSRRVCGSAHCRKTFGARLTISLYEALPYVCLGQPPTGEMAVAQQRADCSLSCRGLSPASSQPLALEPALRWIPATSAGMTWERPRLSFVSDFALASAG